MKIIYLNGYKERDHETAVALGNFDGIHIGHKYLIEDMVKEAKRKKLKSSVLLFKNHTKTILKNDDNKLHIITSNDQKLEILNGLGVETVYILNFDEKIMQLSGNNFVEKIIIESLNAKLVTVGFDYRFGYKASGDSEYLRELGMKMGFDVNIIEPIYIGKEVVSSTEIRNLIKAGDVKIANELLGRQYTITGTVVKGKNRGNKIGYPTANIELNHDFIMPKEGVYKTITILRNKEYLSITNIGYNLTFNEKELKVENHILNFNMNIYDEIIGVKFIDFIRSDTKFNSVEELTKQIKNDVDYVKSNNNIYKQVDM